MSIHGFFLITFVDFLYKASCYNEWSEIYAMVFEKEKSQKVSLEFKRAFSSEQDMHEQVGR